MYAFAYTMQFLALLCALGGGLAVLFLLMQGRGAAVAPVHASSAFLAEKAHIVITGALFIASAILLHALFWHDYSVQYVASYTDNILPAFYRITAFWAGQEGSMLFWALVVGASGSLFACTPSYKTLRPATRLWYWAFFYSIMAFFCLVLCAWNNPFILQSPVPADGRGLNPLLQNPGMIFHPPLLFLGYAGFSVPTCMALAQSLARRNNRNFAEESWSSLTRPFILLAWVFLTAGIVLGMWWAYMELGWGGYWAWDPVENASLAPWLIATAALHTLIVEKRRDKLHRVNVLIMSLTTISAFFATYITRSGVVNSVHAFGDSPIGIPLLVFISVGLVLVVVTAFSAPRTGAPLASLESREGLLTLMAWTLLALAAIILVATMFPVISRLWTVEPLGLDAAFYNRVCLPLGVVLMLFMAACPWFAWNGGLWRRKAFMAVMGSLAAAGFVLWMYDYNQPIAQLTAATSINILLGAVLLLKENGFRSPTFLGALGAHVGMAVLAIGIAFSAPYSEDADLSLAKGETGTVGGYTVTLQELTADRAEGYSFISSLLQISKDGAIIGTIAPQRRIYDKYGNNQFSEVDTIPGLVNEIYASMLGLDQDMRATVRVSIKLMVNWVWIGGAMLCLFPLIVFFRRRRAPVADGGTAPIEEFADTTVVEKPAAKPAGKSKKSRRRK